MKLQLLRTQPKVHLNNNYNNGVLSEVHLFVEYDDKSTVTILKYNSKNGTDFKSYLEDSQSSDGYTLFDRSDKERNEYLKDLGKGNFKGFREYEP